MMSIRGPQSACWVPIKHLTQLLSELVLLSQEWDDFVSTTKWTSFGWGPKASIHS